LLHGCACLATGPLLGAPHLRYVATWTGTRREIEIATETAVADLYERATTLATLAAGKVLERELTGADHQRLIAESIRAVEAAAPGAAPRGAGGSGGSAH
jgi:hypothetical protein